MLYGVVAERSPPPPAPPSQAINIASAQSIGLTTNVTAGGTKALNVTSTQAVVLAKRFVKSINIASTESLTNLRSGYPFKPTDLGTSITKAWYDFGDTSTISDTGGSVDQVTDKSGNANTISSTTTARPVTGTQTLNSRNVLVFDGTDDMLERTASLVMPTITGGVTLLCIRRTTSGTSAGMVNILNFGTGTNGNECGIGRDGGNTGAWGDGTNNSSSSAATYADSDNTNWHMDSAIFTTTSRTIFKDGTSQTTNNNSVVDHTVTHFGVGKCVNLGHTAFVWMNGRIAEVIVLDGTNATNRQKCEGYLMWKYGLQANLPGGHPYLSAPPLV